MRMHKLVKSPILFLFSYIFRKRDKPNTAFKKIRRKNANFALEIFPRQCYTDGVVRFGELAQPVRALASHARGQQFESAILHQKRTAAAAAVLFCGESFIRFEKDAQEGVFFIILIRSALRPRRGAGNRYTRAPRRKRAFGARPFSLWSRLCRRPWTVRQGACQ